MPRRRKKTARRVCWPYPQEQLREAKRLADEQAQAFSAELNKTTAEQCAALEQAAKSHADAAASMIVERIWDSEWQS